jgi:predicted DNA-binding protein
MAKTEYLHIRISPEMKEKLQKLAEAENLTVSNYIENLIIKELNKKGE